jgi:hypothetical protein
MNIAASKPTAKTKPKRVFLSVVLPLADIIVNNKMAHIKIFPILVKV